MGRSRPPGAVAVDGVGRATGQDDYAGLATHRVVDVAAQVLGADVDVDHHQLRLARHQEVPVRRGHGHVFEQARHQRWHALAVGGQRHQRFLDGRSIGAWIQEHVVDAASDQELQDRLSPGASRRP